MQSCSFFLRLLVPVQTVQPVSGHSTLTGSSAASSHVDYVPAHQFAVKKCHLMKQIRKCIDSVYVLPPVAQCQPGGGCMEATARAFHQKCWDQLVRGPTNTKGWKTEKSISIGISAWWSQTYYIIYIYINSMLAQCCLLACEWETLLNWHLANSDMVYPLAKDVIGWIITPAQWLSLLGVEKLRWWVYF